MKDDNEELETYNIEEFVRLRFPHSDWGPWRLRTGGYYALQLEEGNELTGGFPYAVDLDQCTTSAAVLDWIMQIAGKAWADPECLAGLVNALDDILHPQQNLCSDGESKTLSRAQIRELADARAREATGE